MPTNITAKWADGGIDVSFKKPANESQVQKYAVMVVPATLKDFTLKTATAKSIDSNMKFINVNEEYAVTFKADDTNVAGNRLSDKNSYYVYILSVGEKKSVLSNPVSIVKADAKATVQGKNNLSRGVFEKNAGSMGPGIFASCGEMGVLYKTRFSVRLANACMDIEFAI
ncbi:hypothetical protein VQ056_06350 [Paenibacillus sp. JTLBN-2024]